MASLSLQLSSLHHTSTTLLILRTVPLNLHTPTQKPFSIGSQSPPVLSQDDLKKLAADKAVESVKSGMILGLGTGSTAAFVVDKLGQLLSTASSSFVVVADDSKLVSGLGGSGLAMPVEIVQFCWKYNLVRLEGLFKELGCEAKLMLVRDGSEKPHVTDNGNYIVDLYFKNPIKDGFGAGKEISALEGVVEHGLFLGMATSVIIAGKWRL
ncbi:hypothetical protein CRYUN_Cryun09bG0193000 [Craigia yunnanensis]